MKVVGEFDIGGVIHANVMDLWEQTKLSSGIPAKDFFEYFTGRKYGYAIEIADVRRYETPLPLKEHFGIHPPQSFVYLPAPPKNGREHLAVSGSL